jgi:hypothetical protein
MDAYDICTNLGKNNLADSEAIYGQEENFSHHARSSFKVAGIEFVCVCTSVVCNCLINER